MFTATRALDSFNMPFDKPTPLIFVRPESKEARAVCKGYIPTTHLVTILANALIDKQTAQQNLAFSHMSRHAATRSAAGWIFENFMHVRLTTVYKPISCVDRNDRVTNIVIPTTENFVTGTLDQLNSSTLPCYWRPGTSGFPGIDSVIRTRDELWVFRATVGRHRGTANEGLTCLSQHLGATVVKQIAPGRRSKLGRRTIGLLEYGRSLAKFPMYSCQLDSGLSRFKDNVADLKSRFEGSHPYNPNALYVHASE
ncbi:hypothetical protein BC835DRAFT_831801 [Cytidiella melzeri]|nr:hypothetical protein BC835DRAFT_831801 [Cytidiella melzeri]